MSLTTGAILMQQHSSNDSCSKPLPVTHQQTLAEVLPSDITSTPTNSHSEAQQVSLLSSVSLSSKGSIPLDAPLSRLCTPAAETVRYDVHGSDARLLTTVNGKAMSRVVQGGNWRPNGLSQPPTVTARPSLPKPTPTLHLSPSDSSSSSVPLSLPTSLSVNSNVHSTNKATSLPARGPIEGTSNLVKPMISLPEQQAIVYQIPTTASASIPAGIIGMNHSPVLTPANSIPNSLMPNPLMSNPLMTTSTFHMNRLHQNGTVLQSTGKPVGSNLPAGVSLQSQRLVASDTKCENGIHEQDRAIKLPTPAVRSRIPSNDGLALTPSVVLGKEIGDLKEMTTTMMPNSTQYLLPQHLQQLQQLQQYQQSRQSQVGLNAQSPSHQLSHPQYSIPPVIMGQSIGPRLPLMGPNGMFYPTSIPHLGWLGGLASLRPTLRVSTGPSSRSMSRHKHCKSSSKYKETASCEISSRTTSSDTKQEQAMPPSFSSNGIERRKSEFMANKGADNRCGEQNEHSVVSSTGSTLTTAAAPTSQTISGDVSKRGTLLFSASSQSSELEDEETAMQSLDLPLTTLTLDSLGDASQQACGKTFSVKESEIILKQLQSSPTTSMLATSLEGMYGENKMSSLLYLCRILQRYFWMDSSSIFLDIGSGRGSPNTVAAVATNVKSSIGVEIDEVAFNLSLRNQVDLYSVLLPKRISQHQDTWSSAGDCRIAFSCLDAVLLQTLDPATHVFSFDLAMPVFMIEKFVSLFNASSTAIVFVTFRRDLSEFTIEAEPVCQVLMEMIVSGEKHRATIYVKRTHLHRLAASIPHFKDRSMTSPPTTLASDSPSTKSEEIGLSTEHGRGLKMTGSGSDANGGKTTSHVELNLRDLLNFSKENAAFRCSACHGFTRISSGDVLHADRSTKSVRQSTRRKPAMRKMSCETPTKVPKSDSGRNVRRSSSSVKFVSAQSTSFVCPAFWAACDLCGRWRQLPGCTAEEYEELNNVPFWTCSMNKWDVHNASCNAPQAAAAEEEVAVEVVRWVQCEECLKWRALPGCSALEYKAIQRKDLWVCSMNEWDKARASCDVPEESNDTPSLLHQDDQKSAIDQGKEHQMLQMMDQGFAASPQTKISRLTRPSTGEPRSHTTAVRHIRPSAKMDTCSNPIVNRAVLSLPALPASLTQCNTNSLSNASATDAKNKSSVRNNIVVENSTLCLNANGVTEPPLIQHSYLQQEIPCAQPPFASGIDSHVVAQSQTGNHPSDCNASVSFSIDADCQSEPISKDKRPGDCQTLSSTKEYPESSVFNSDTPAEAGKSDAQQDSAMNDDSKTASETATTTCLVSDGNVDTNQRRGSNDAQKLQSESHAVVAQSIKEEDRQQQQLISEDMKYNEVGLSKGTSLCNPQANNRNLDDKSIGDEGLNHVDNIIDQYEDESELLFLPPVLLHRCKDFIKAKVMSHNKIVVSYTPSSVSNKTKHQKLNAIWKRRLDYYDQLVNEPIQQQQQQPSQSAPLQSDKNVDMTLTSHTTSDESKDHSNEILTLPGIHRRKSPRIVPKKIINLSETPRLDRVGHLERLVRRTQLPIIQQTEWAYLELARWLGSSAKTRRKSSSWKQQQQQQLKSGSPKHSAHYVLRSPSSKKRRRYYDKPAEFIDQDLKLQRHKDMEEALDEKWQYEIDLKDELIEKGLWCKCESARRRRAMLYKPPLLIPGQLLVNIEPPIVPKHEEIDHHHDYLNNNNNSSYRKEAKNQSSKIDVVERKKKEDEDIDLKANSEDIQNDDNNYAIVISRKSKRREKLLSPREKEEESIKKESLKEANNNKEEEVLEDRGQNKEDDHQEALMDMSTTLENDELIKEDSENEPVTDHHHTSNNVPDDSKLTSYYRNDGKVVWNREDEARVVSEILSSKSPAAGGGRYRNETPEERRRRLEDYAVAMAIQGETRMLRSRTSSNREDADRSKRPTTIGRPKQNRNNNSEEESDRHNNKKKRLR